MYHHKNLTTLIDFELSKKLSSGIEENETEETEKKKKKKNKSSYISKVYNLNIRQPKRLNN